MNEQTVVQECVLNADGYLISFKAVPNNNETMMPDEITEGMFCIFNDEESLFPGNVIRLSSENITINILKKNI